MHDQQRQHETQNTAGSALCCRILTSKSQAAADAKAVAEAKAKAEAETKAAIEKAAAEKTIAEAFEAKAKAEAEKMNAKITEQKNEIDKLKFELEKVAADAKVAILAIIGFVCVFVEESFVA